MPPWTDVVLEYRTNDFLGSRHQPSLSNSATGCLFVSPGGWEFFFEIHRGQKFRPDKNDGMRPLQSDTAQ